MLFTDRIKHMHSESQQIESPQISPALGVDEKGIESSDIQLQTGDRGGLSETAGDGVKAARATTIVWSKHALLLAYGL